MTRGKYIVIEGPEGVGKTTQILELARRLRAAGLPLRTLAEPDSQSDLTARTIRQLIKDARYPMNNRTEVLLYNAARSQSLDIVKRSVEHGVICLVDRNYLTTLAVQYYGRGDVPDYQIINGIIDFAVDGIEPDLCVVLDAPANTLHDRLQGRQHNGSSDDLDVALLERVRAGYLWEAKQRNLPVVYATDSFEIVADKIWQLVSRTLALRAPSRAVSVEPAVSVKQVIEELLPKLEQPINPPTKPTTQTSSTTDSQATESLLTKDSAGNLHTTTAGEAFLAAALTAGDSNVYAFSDKLSPATIAQAMARLSRHGGDMRISLLAEFTNSTNKDIALAERDSYGPVQQLDGLHFVVEDASKLLTKKLEWGRLAAYSEPSLVSSDFEQQDSTGRYRYYVPAELKPGMRKQYEAAMDTIFELYSSILRKLTVHVRAKSATPIKERDATWQDATRAQACAAIRPVLPVAMKSTVGGFASGQALESLIMHLLSDELPEAQATGQKLLDQVRQVRPLFLQQVDKTESGGAITAYRANTHKQMAKLAKQYLPDTHAVGDTAPVTLVDFWPKNELLLTADMLYEHSDLPLEQLQSEVNSWSYQQKTDVFKSYMGKRLNRRQRPGRAIEKAHYSWDLVCDYDVFYDLQRHRMVDDLNWQLLSPRYGYDTPDLIEAAGLSEQFDACFDVSLKLYSLLQASGYGLQAQYATLLGHKMRWEVTYNAREAFHLHELRTMPQCSQGSRKLILTMHDKLSEVHPLLAEAMQFVDKAKAPSQPVEQPPATPKTY